MQSVPFNTGIETVWVTERCRISGQASRMFSYLVGFMQYE